MFIRVKTDINTYYINTDNIAYIRQGQNTLEVYFANGEQSLLLADEFAELFMDAFETTTRVYHA